MFFIVTTRRSFKKRLLRPDTSVLAITIFILITAPSYTAQDIASHSPFSYFDSYEHTRTARYPEKERRETAP